MNYIARFWILSVIGLTSCNLLSELEHSTEAIRSNSEAIEESTYLITMNQQAVHESSVSIQQNRDIVDHSSDAILANKDIVLSTNQVLETNVKILDSLNQLLEGPDNSKSVATGITAAGVVLGLLFAALISIILLLLRISYLLKRPSTHR
jgi:Ulp1 family protease